MRKILFIICFFCLSRVMAFAQNVDSLMTVAKSLVEQNQPADAAQLYEKIVETDTHNYEALAFLGNYQFLSGKQFVDKADSDFQALSQPNRMQVARYQNELKRIYAQYYEKANIYLTKALEVRKNDHLSKLLMSIQALKERVDQVPAKTKKK